MEPFMNPVVVKLLLLLLHLVPMERQEIPVTLIQETKVVGTYTITPLETGQYRYLFKGEWEEAKSFTAERSSRYAHLYLVYPDPNGEPLAVNMGKDLQALTIPPVKESASLGEGEETLILYRDDFFFLVGAEAVKLLVIIPKVPSGQLKPNLSRGVQ
jgi:hypothetical protein